MWYIVYACVSSVRPSVRVAREIYGLSSYFAQILSGISEGYCSFVVLGRRFSVSIFFFLPVLYFSVLRSKNLYECSSGNRCEQLIFVVNVIFDFFSQCLRKKSLFHLKCIFLRDDRCFIFHCSWDLHSRCFDIVTSFRNLNEKRNSLRLAGKPGNVRSSANTYGGVGN